MALGFQQILFSRGFFFWLPNKANEIGASLWGDGDPMEEMDTPLGFWGPCGRDRDPHEGQRGPMGEMETALGRWRFCGGDRDPVEMDMGTPWGEMETSMGRWTPCGGERGFSMQNLNSQQIQPKTQRARENSSALGGQHHPPRDLES